LIISYLNVLVLIKIVDFLYVLKIKVFLYKRVSFTRARFLHTLSLSLSQSVNFDWSFDRVEKNGQLLCFPQTTISIRGRRRCQWDHEPRRDDSPLVHYLARESSTMGWSLGPTEPTKTSRGGGLAWVNPSM